MIIFDIFFIFLVFNGFFNVFFYFIFFFIFFLSLDLFEIFWNFCIFFWFLGLTFKVTKVTTTNYQGYYWTPKIAKNCPKQHNKLFFCRKAQTGLRWKAQRFATRMSPFCLKFWAQVESQFFNQIKKQRLGQNYTTQSLTKLKNSNSGKTQFLTTLNFKT